MQAQQQAQSAGSQLSSVMEQVIVRAHILNDCCLCLTSPKKHWIVYFCVCVSDLGMCVCVWDAARLLLGDSALQSGLHSQRILWP